MHRCALAEGETGRCRARKNIGGIIRAVNYGRLTAIALDPIEKKPLARFYPGTMILSVGSYGCNMSCPFCQNAAISMASAESAQTRLVKPDELAEVAISLKEKGNIGVAFTYNEPLVGYEYVKDAAKTVKRRGMKTVAVTNGAASLEVLAELRPWIDAYNIDLKSFSSSYYQKLGGDLEMVKAFIKEAVKDAHVELTTLIVPKGNDSEEEMAALSSWVGSLDRSITLHLSRFFPAAAMSGHAPTEIATLHRLREIALKNLDEVILGNV